MISSSSFFTAGGNGTGFDAANKSTAYTAWSGLTQLVNKYCYVHAWSNPKLHRLTPEGRGTRSAFRTREGSFK